MKTTPALTLYLDASVLVSLFYNDSGSARAQSRLKATADEILLRDFARLEFVSTIAKLVRVRAHNDDGARAAFAALDTWSARFTTPIETTHADMVAAQAIIRRLDTKLRTGDALHVAIADRIGATIATFDHTLAAAALERGVMVVS